MAFFLLCLFTFVMFFQPAFVFPWLAVLRPYRHSALLALVFFLFLGKKSDTPLLSIPNVRFFFLFVIWQVASAATIWLHGGFYTFKDIWLNLIIIYVLIVKSCTNERKIKAIMLVVVAAIFYLSYASLTDLFTDYYPGKRPLGFGWYEYPNDLVLILACVIPLALCFAELSKSIIIRFFFIAVATMFSVNILLSASRNGLLGLMAVGGLSLMFMKNISRFFRYFTLTVLIVSIMTFGISKVLTRGHLAGSLTGDESSEGRIVQWKACLRMVKEHPLFGVGPGESRFQMREYGGIPGMIPHNTLVQVFAETGIPGGVFFIMFSIMPIWEAWKIYKTQKEKLNLPPYIIYKYLIIVLTGFWACAFFSNRVYFKILYVIIALIVALRYNILGSYAEAAEEKNGN